MRIGIIGGLDRVEERFERMAASVGHEAVFHTGHVSGRGAKTLTDMIERCDVVVVVTDLNSHGAVQLTRRVLRSRGREPVLLRRCGTGRFAALLSGL